MFSMIFSDPVVWGSLLGILIMIIMAGYYAYMFMHNSNSAYTGSEKQDKQ